MSRRRGGAGRVVVISWRDIPAQVTAGAGADAAKVLLPPRFQHAIDRAAVVGGVADASSYVAQWRRSTEPLVGDPTAAAEAAAARLSNAFPRERLAQLVETAGWDESEVEVVDHEHANDGVNDSPDRNDEVTM